MKFKAFIVLLQIFGFVFICCSDGAGFVWQTGKNFDEQATQVGR